MISSFSLSWKRFAFSAVALSIVPALLLFVNLRADIFNEAIWAIIILWISGITFFGYRWYRMRKNLYEGKYTEEDFRKNPVGIILGSTLFAVSWFLTTLALVLSLSLFLTLRA